AYSARNRSASIRIPYVSNPKARRVEARFPDPLANPYLAFSALMMAGLDGVQNKIHPGDPADKNLDDLPPEEDAKIPPVCSAVRAYQDQAGVAPDARLRHLTGERRLGDDLLDAYLAHNGNDHDRLHVAAHPVEFDPSSPK